MPEREPFEYAILRLVPSIERGESINVGVMLICRPKAFLGLRTFLDRGRLLALAPDLSISQIEEIEEHLSLAGRIADGSTDGGPIARLEPGERWHWLSAPSSTILQPSTTHTGMCLDPQQQLDALFDELVRMRRRQEG